MDWDRPIETPTMVPTITIRSQSGMTDFWEDVCM